MIHGNIEGIRSTLLAEMETLYTMKIPQDTFAPTELLSLLSRFCGAINREISVYISRKGEVLNVSIGGLDSVELPEIRLRRNADRLSCVRCIHTHPGGDPTLSDVDLQALMNMRFDAMAALGVLEGCATAMQAAFLGERIKGIPQPLIMAPVSAEHIPQAAWMEEIQRSEQRVLQGDEASFFKREERAILIGMESEDSLLELASLAKTAGAQVVGSMMQKRDKPDNATYIGSGKAERLALDVQAQDCDLVIFDDELTGAQIHNLETLLQVKVVDRTTLILDIFAQRAQSREGKLQVELAQLSYQLPRLMGEGISMSRLGGGIGTRGPGETKLEVERRRLRKRMVDLRHELEDLTQQRGLQRACRQKGDLPVVALVGYTNTGKSTLLNALSGADVLAEDKLFATLDPVTRRVTLADGGTFLLVDTVGFIRKLPTTLVNAFRSTLEETVLADLLLIIHDASSPDMMLQHQVVQQVLTELGAGDKPQMDVLNKCDVADESSVLPGAVRISASTGAGLETLKTLVSQRVCALRRQVTLFVPYAMGAVLTQLHTDGQVMEEQYEAEGTLVTVQLTQSILDRILRKLGTEALRKIEG